MAENSPNGHANGETNGDAPHNPQPLAPRVAAPEGARSARAFDGTPLEIAAPQINENSAPNAENLGAENLGAEGFGAEGFGAGASEVADYRADLQQSFCAAPAPDDPLQSDAPRWGDIEIAPPLGIDIEEADSAPDNWRADRGADITGVNDIEGEQLFAGSAETDPMPQSGGGSGGGDEPPSPGLATMDGGGRPDTPRDQELGLMAHLVELRSRLIYGILGVAVMMCVTWNFSKPLQSWFSAPIQRTLHENGIAKGELISLDPTAFFTITFQFSLISALILAAPWVSFQVWRFVEPALTNSERRYTLVLVPFSSALFFLGAGLGYLVAPLFFKFFLQYQPEGVAAQWDYYQSIMLMAKMLLIFGLAFQVPIIIIFGHKIGLISRNLLIEYWRHAVVVIFTVVAILTPTWDPFTMTVCAVPPCLLYLLSIWLVKWL